MPQQDKFWMMESLSTSLPISVSYFPIINESQIWFKILILTFKTIHCLSPLNTLVHLHYIYTQCKSSHSLKADNKGQPAMFAMSYMVGQEGKRTNNRTMFPGLKNNAAAGYKDPVKTELLACAGLLNNSINLITSEYDNAPFNRGV